MKEMETVELSGAVLHEDERWRKFRCGRVLSAAFTWVRVER
jgi:hypothetical protein